LVTIKKIVGGRKPKKPDHAVIILFQYGKSDLQPILDFKDKLERTINEARVGRLDGIDIAEGGGDGYLYMYGPDADRLFSVIRHILESSAFMNGATIRLRYGPPEVGVKEKEVKIGLIL
jgi:hypothetical protein